MVNIIANAVKFTKVGGLRILLSIQHLDKFNLATLTFSVQDTGIGITAQGIERLFNPFVRVHSDEFGGYSGSGLGLVISKRFVEALNGEMRVDSKIGEGSNFIITLPVIKSASTPPVQGSPEIKTVSDLPGFADLIKSQHILIVEDNMVNYRILSQMLKKYQCRVAHKSDGESALINLADVRYDLIMMDISMSGMSGMEASQRIRQDCSNTYGQPFIVACTANCMPDD